MSPRLLATIPSKLLFAKDTGPLMAWLAERNWHLSLLDLANERARRKTHRKENSHA